MILIKIKNTELLIKNYYKKDYLQKQLREKNIETNQVHFRNDKYSIFKKFAKNQKFENAQQGELYKIKNTNIYAYF